MINLKKYLRLKSEVERKQREADKAAGAYEQLMERLEKEFGLESLEEAKSRLEELDQEIEELESEFNKELSRFEKEYSDEV